MITKCILAYVMILSNFGSSNANEIMDLTDCDQYIPDSCYEYATLLVEHFDEENIENAVKIMWCESRNNADAFRYQDFDSGLFQVIPSSWGWVKQNYDVPHWDYPIGDNYAQHIPRYNIQVASILVEDIHSRNPYWKVFSSSQWCWEDTDKWIKKWKGEEYGNN